VRWGDLDGDGRADLATANTDQPNDIYSVEKGELVLRWSSPESDPSQGIAWGDFDGDGDLDLAVANMGKPNRLYRNQAGELHLYWSEPMTSQSKDASWADVDKDGDLDLLFANVGPNRLWLNEGGLFKVGSELQGSFETDALELADVDADGDLDLISANSGDVPEPDQLQLWDKGAFGISYPIGPAQRSSSVAWLKLSKHGPGVLAISKPENDDVIIRLGPAAEPGWEWSRTAAPKATIPTQTIWSSGDKGHSREVRRVDFDSDGTDEALWAVGGVQSLLDAEGEVFVRRWAIARSFLTEGIDLADANGDGLLDLAVGSRDGDVEVSAGQPGGVAVQVYLQSRLGYSD
jgi:hypothetical protein